VVFNVSPQLVGFTYNPITGAFTCVDAGKYLVSYSVNILAAINNQSASVIGTINNIEIVGSAATHVAVLDPNQLWANFFIVDLLAADVFSLQFTGSSLSVLISASAQLAGETPISASITITRIV
jgi:hypothetical protein